MNWENFAKYVGVQGVLVVIMTLGIVGGIFISVEVPGELYSLLGLSWGFYFGKNGRNVISKVKGGKDGSL